jgi:hypothetical protein
VLRNKGDISMMTYQRTDARGNPCLQFLMRKTDRIDVLLLLLLPLPI